MLFNNDYYKSIVREDRYPFWDNVCTKVTDAEGNKPKTRWVTTIWRNTPGLGPVQWIHQNYVCPNCVEEVDDPCCQNVPSGNFCNADSVDISTDSDVNFGGCERYRLITGLDETALPCEIGLYFDFNVTTDGIPTGCPGFEIFNANYFNISKCTS